MTTSNDFRDAAALQRIQDALWTTASGTRASVMVGAGFSKLARRVSADVPEPPLWSDFSREMTKSLYPSVDPRSVPQDPLRLAQEYFAVHGGSGVDALIRRLIRDSDWQPSDAHERLVALPWANILTTNWDTLLERAAIRSVTSSYDIVRSVEDIPHTVAPRIVKLHGSLPSNTPFIFTEENYRTYPRDFAPFVNLAQHAMMESVCCLIGFSGADPNFLQWSGWVRDNLGRNAPTIYLVGALNISSSQRRMLEARNVYPVDLSPLVETADRNQQYSDAIRLFLELLKKSEPKAAHKWPHVDSLDPALKSFQQLDDKADATRESQITREALPALSALRAAYPGWVVASAGVRSSVEHAILPWKAIASRAFTEISRKEQHRLIYELAWLHSIALLPPSYQLRRWMIELLEGEVEFELPASEVDQLAFWLLQDARQQLDFPQYGKWLDYLEKRTSKSQELSTAILHERCLLARDLLRYDELEELADRVEGDDPMWKVRRAALLSELGAVEKARRALQEAVQDLRLRRSSGARSIWLDSRFAWLSLLASSIRPHHLRGNHVAEVEAEFLEDDKWQARYAQIKSDPWAELRSTIDQLRTRIEHLKELKPAARSLFDAGHYLPSQRTRTIGRAIDADVSIVGRRIVDGAGVPNALDHIGFPARTIRTQCAELETTREPMALLRAISVLADHKDSLLEKVLNRISVAQLTEACAETVSDALFKAIKFSRSKLRSAGPESSMFWTERVRTLLEIASRISVRLSASTAKLWFEFAMEFAESPECSQWWLFEVLGHLIARSLEPLEAKERGALTLGLFKFPLASERRVFGPDREWPEPSKFLERMEIDRSDNEEAWSIRIQQLIVAVRQAEENSRTSAALRLLALRERKALTDAETMQLSASLWARTSEQTSLPADVNLLPHVFIQLDASRAPTVEAAVRSKWFAPTMDKFNREAVEVLLGLTSVFRRSARPLTLAEAEAIALVAAIVRQTVNWSSERREDDPFDLHPTNDRYLKKQSGLLIADGALPAISSGNGSAELETLLTAIESKDAAHLTPSLPELARVSPHLKARAMSALQRAIKSSDETLIRGGYEGVLRWIDRVDRPEMPAFPDWLAHSIAVHISLRRRPGLYEALLCGLRLLEKVRLEASDVDLVVEGLSFLSTETNYDRFAGDDNAARAITLERQLCVRIARLLMANGRQDEALQQWVTIAKSDPLPEVRLAVA